jgi:hypothetical protein
VTNGSPVKELAALIMMSSIPNPAVVQSTLDTLQNPIDADLDIDDKG